MAPFSALPRFWVKLDIGRSNCRKCRVLSRIVTFLLDCFLTPSIRWQVRPGSASQPVPVPARAVLRQHQPMAGGIGAVCNSLANIVTAIDRLDQQGSVGSFQQVSRYETTIKASTDDRDCWYRIGSQHFRALLNYNMNRCGTGTSLNLR